LIVFFTILNKDIVGTKVLFLDRDGVINKDIGYCNKIHDFQFIDGIFDVCKYAKLKGFEIIIVTNQSGIGRGFYSDEDFKRLNKWMLSQLKTKSINILDTYYCPHRPEDCCTCRKPLPGLILKAQKEHSIDLESSWLIGDKETDIKAAQLAGIDNNILFTNKKEDSKTEAKVIINSLYEFKEISL
jgi:D-glycero-D-manno-heptose 1,7-bisphosphate phosphatase